MKQHQRASGVGGVTGSRLAEDSPVGQGLQGSVHVAGVAYVLQPRQA